jgi:hypothetical protein
MPCQAADIDRSKALLKLVSNLFDKWELTEAERRDLLGPDDELEDRAGWLLSIHKALRLLYPENPEICYSWVKRRNQVFDNQTPLQIMLQSGIPGMKAVAFHLDSRIFDSGSGKPCEGWEKAFKAMHAAGNDELLLQ